MNNPLYVLDGALFTFNVQSPDCNATTFHDINIISTLVDSTTIMPYSRTITCHLTNVSTGRNEDRREPNVTIHGSNRLILGQRNSILCTVEFYDEQSNGRPPGAFGAWYVNGTTFDLGYLDSDCNPLEDTDLVSEIQIPEMLMLVTKLII